MTQQPNRSNNPPTKRQIQLEVPADLAALYVNFALITNSMSEIVIDVAQVLPNTPKARVQARVVMTPTNAKLLHKALGESISKYEAVHGEVKVPPTLADQLFKSARTGDGEDEGGSNE
ncbi:MAG: DUF3467 domain-containing protein [Anaerolineae bacterium]|nr:DUF3467 domain-containing protein [Anaerolineae bacterium]